MNVTVENKDSLNKKKSIKMAETEILLCFHFILSFVFPSITLRWIELRVYFVVIEINKNMQSFVLFYQVCAFSFSLATRYSR